MPPLTKKLTDIAIAIALTMGVVFLIVVSNSFLTARGTYWVGINTWLALVQRADIVGTMVLTAIVTTAYGMWQQTKKRG
jgi:hypothetical protein